MFVLIGWALIWLNCVCCLTVDFKLSFLITWVLVLCFEVVWISAINYFWSVVLLYFVYCLLWFVSSLVVFMWMLMLLAVIIFGWFVWFVGLVACYFWVCLFVCCLLDCVMLLIVWGCYDWIVLDWIYCEFYDERCFMICL